MRMLKDFYVTYRVLDEGDPDDYFYLGGQNLGAYDRNDAIQQVEEMFGKYGKVVIEDVEQISDDEV